MIAGGMKMDDMEKALDIADILDINTNEIYSINTISILPDKYKGKISIQHVKQLLLDAIK